jgi:hypothetical protein
MAMIIERATGFVEFSESRAIEAIWLSPSKEMLAISIKGPAGATLAYEVLDEGQAAVLAVAVENAARQFRGHVDYGQGMIYLSPQGKDDGLTQELMDGLVDGLMAAGLVKAEDALAVKGSKTARAC